MICQTATIQAVCQKCQFHFVKLGPACPTCATPLLCDDIAQCGACMRHPPALDSVITHYRYTEPLRTIIHHFKFKQELYLAPFLAQLILQTLPQQFQTDCILPVPIHIKRLRERGFNQTLLLAKPLASYLKCPIKPRLCKKRIHTPTQASLKKQQRIKNLHKVYQVIPNTYQHVTLIDDLITTGSTANEIARALKKSGVKEVHLICCAKTCFT